MNQTLKVEVHSLHERMTQAGKWLVDSGASSHMTWNQKLLTDYKEFEKVQLGDQQTVDAVGIGNIHLMMFNVREPKKSVMYKVLYVPQLSCNLFSVRAAASKGNLLDLDNLDVGSKMAVEGSVEWGH